MAGTTQWYDCTTMSGRGLGYTAAPAGSGCRCRTYGCRCPCPADGCSFDWGEPVADLSFLAEKLNRLLPKDIAVYRIVPVRPEAHARFDATSRTYKYYITTRKDSFNYDLVYRMSGQLDFEAMNEACKVLFDYIDFTSFSKLHTDVKTNNCRIYKAGWEQEGDVWVFTVQADRFLRNMVRAIVGTLLEVGRGKLTIEGFRKVIEAKDRCKAELLFRGMHFFLWM